MEHLFSIGSYLLYYSLHFGFFLPQSCICTSQLNGYSMALSTQAWFARGVSCQPSTTLSKHPGAAWAPQTRLDVPASSGEKEQLHAHPPGPTTCLPAFCPDKVSTGIVFRGGSCFGIIWWWHKKTFI